jgi:predicted MFS family arabinose efflux permease
LTPPFCQTKDPSLLSALGLLAVASFAFIVERGNIAIYIIAAAAAGMLYAVANGITQSGIVAEALPSKTESASGAYESAVGIGSTIGPIASGLVSSGSLLTAFYVPIIGIFGVIVVFSILFVVLHLDKKINNDVAEMASILKSPVRS